ncbi:MAG TPA: hypothetical protein VF103_06005 [Polyangiaceae bacterium]
MVLAAECAGLRVIKLEERARFATLTVGRDVGASKAVAIEDFAACGAGDAGARLRVVRGRSFPLRVT